MRNITKRGRWALPIAAVVGGVLVLAPLSPAQAATAKSGSVGLTLGNGWKSAAGLYQTGRPELVVDGAGVVHLAGGILHGDSSSLAFTLPVADRPSHTLYIDTYTYSGTVGYLRIQTDGGVYPNGAGASKFTDLDSISFPTASSSLAFVGVNPVDGWISADATYGTGDPAAALDSEGYVHLEGSIKNGASGTLALTLPVGKRPAKNVYLNVYTVSGSQGLVRIEPNGHVLVFGDGASGYTSLAGISFRLNKSIVKAHALTLGAGWTSGAYSSGKAIVSRDQYGFAHLNGGLSNPGNGGAAFVLPKADRPPHALYVTTYTFNGATGTATIATDGTVTFYGQPTNGTPPFTSDEFTSIDGLTFKSVG